MLQDSLIASGCIEVYGVDDNGEPLYTVNLERLKEQAPKEYKAYMTYVYSAIDESLEAGDLNIDVEINSEGPTVSYY
jgi:hypothetical protein